MGKTKLSFCSEPCNASAVVWQALDGEGSSAPAETVDAAEMCGALRAAMTFVPEEKAAVICDEFVKLLGASDCGSLKGRRCEYHTRLASELARKQLRSSDSNGKIRVLLLGDSIRHNYESFVREELGDRYEVVSPEENCRFAKYTLNELSRWIDTCGEPDIIHWNNGLWDSAVVCREDGMFTPPEEYLRYMSIILRELRKHTDHVIFATTTPVRDGSLNQHIEFIDRLNAAVVPHMKANGVEINDLYSVVLANREEFLRDDCIHLSPKGIEACGKAVADAIRAMKIRQ